MANDLAYVVQAIAPNFVWKTTAFPAARKGYTWVVILQGVLIVVTATIQSLLWRDEKNAQAEVNDQAVETDNLNVVVGKN
ncbi:hypothetical protein KCU94_g10162, partial [Aureobasidium melanogenum]